MSVAATRLAEQFTLSTDQLLALRTVTRSAAWWVLYKAGTRRAQAGPSGREAMMADRLFTCLATLFQPQKLWQMCLVPVDEDFKGEGRVCCKVLPQRSHGQTKETTNNPPGLPVNPNEIRTRYVPNTSLERYRYANLTGRGVCDV
jgi:hypothetical protein